MVHVLGEGRHAQQMWLQCPQLTLDYQAVLAAAAAAAGLPAPQTVAVRPPAIRKRGETPDQRGQQVAGPAAP